jgi:hypothetical protein
MKRTHVVELLFVLLVVILATFLLPPMHAHAAVPGLLDDLQADCTVGADLVADIAVARDAGVKESRVLDSLTAAIDANEGFSKSARAALKDRWTMVVDVIYMTPDVPPAVTVHHWRTAHQCYEPGA